MSLPRIPGAEPVVKPATEEKTYPDRFITSLNIRAEPDGAMQATIRTIPYNYDTGDFVRSDMSQRRIPDLAALAAERAAAGKPKLAQALTLVLEAVAELEAE